MMQQLQFIVASDLKPIIQQLQHAILPVKRRLLVLHSSDMASGIETLRNPRLQ
jgi:hypothetical protein